MDCTSMPLARFLSGRSDEITGFSYLKSLMNNNTTRLLIFEHVKQLIQNGQVTISIELQSRNVIISSDSTNYGGMIIDQTIKNWNGRNVLHPDLPQIIVARVNEFGLPDCYYIPMEFTKILLSSAHINELMIAHYGRWRPPHVILKNQGSGLPIEINSEEEK